MALCASVGVRGVSGVHAAPDSPIFHKLLHCFEAGDILCGDRAFCTYELMGTLHSREVHTVMRLHQARHRVLDCPTPPARHSR